MEDRIFKVDIVIVGGGVAGLGLACALSSFDLSVLVIEKRSEPGGIHRGDSLLPKATKLLFKWGLKELLYKTGARAIDHMEIHHPKHGMIYQAPLVSNGDSHPYLVLRHALIEQALQEYALQSKQTRLIRCAKFTGLIRDPKTNRVCGIHFRDKEGKAQALASLVVGCDGQKSLVRKKLGIKDHPYKYDHAYLGLEAQRPPTYKDAMRIHLHPEGGVLFMPHESEIGVGVLVDEGKANEWLNKSDNELANDLTKRAPLLKGMKLYRKGEHVYRLACSHVKNYCVDGAVIIGDAAHRTNPTGGQGMAMALTDAGALAELVAPSLAKGGFLENTLAAFEKQLWPINQKLVRSTHLLSLAYSLRGNTWHRLKTGMLRMIYSPLALRFIRPVIGSFLK